MQCKMQNVCDKIFSMVYYVEFNTQKVSNEDVALKGNFLVSVRIEDESRNGDGSNVKQAYTWKYFQEHEL